MRKIAIIGLSPSSHDLAPWDDPEWEKWGLPWDSGYWAKCDRLFEIHEKNREAFIHENILSAWVPVYMKKQHDEYPTSIEYPLDKVSSVVGDYYTSSICYMIALAIYENVDVIGLWGVDADEGYEFQRSNTEYLIGFAKGRGIDVIIHESSPLLKYKCIHTHVHYKYRYGYLDGDY